MTIIKTPAYKTEDGATHIDIEAAQTHALIGLLGKDTAGENATALIMNNKDAIVSILTATGRKPRKRTKPAKAKKASAKPAPPPAPVLETPF